MMHSQTNISLTFAMNVAVHSKQAQSIGEELGKDVDLEDGVEIADVDCTTGKATCTSVGIRSYPTLKLFYDGEDHKTYKGSASLYNCEVFHLSESARKLGNRTIKLRDYNCKNFGLDFLQCFTIMCGPSMLYFVFFFGVN